MIEARWVLRINPACSIAKDETWVKSAGSAAERQRRTELLRKVGLPEWPLYGGAVWPASCSRAVA